MRAQTIALALALSACATPSRPELVVGPFASRLSAEDVRQIRIVAVSGGHLALQKIYAFEPNRVRVDAGAETSFVRFILIKRKNHWATDNSPEAIAEIENFHRVH